MVSYHQILIQGALFFISIEKVSSLECYSCSSYKEPKCGATWKFSGTESGIYKVSCDGQTSACRKLDSFDSPKNVNLVTRSCWNVSNSDPLTNDFLTCRKAMGTGQVCYCNDNKGGQPCNGFSSLLPARTLVFSIITAIFLIK